MNKKSILALAWISLCACQPQATPPANDLIDEFAHVGIGDSAEQVRFQLGTPNSESTTNTLGVERSTLIWADQHYRYSTDFVAGRLINKSQATH